MLFDKIKNKVYGYYQLWLQEHRKYDLYALRFYIPDMIVFLVLGVILCQMFK